MSSAKFHFFHRLLPVVSTSSISISDTALCIIPIWIDWSWKILWDQHSHRCPCLVLILSIRSSIRRCGKNWNPLITQILPISHTICPILSHYLFRFLRTRSFNYASIPLIFSTFRPGFFYYSFHLFALFIPNHSLWTGRNHQYLRDFSRKSLSQ